MTLLALSVCVLFYIGAGKDGITIVPEETKFSEVKRKNLLWFLQMLLFAWTVHAELQDNYSCVDHVSLIKDLVG